jgi:DNA-binding NtrC family response regulator
MAQKQHSSEIVGTDAMASGYKVSLPSTVRLVVIAGPDRGRQIALGAAAVRVGKADDCALALSDPAVSRQHLELEVTPAGVVVRDLGSTNGSFLGGTRFREVTVGVGVMMQIGGTTLRLCGPDDTGPGLLPSEAERFGRLVGRSLRMRELYAVLERMAKSDAPVLIEGETGTGKEVCAEALHAASARSSGPFVICDLGGVSRSLIDSELFGHVRGAFTGADRDRKGLFAEAQGGTLFLDEIGELELDIQPRLLRAIEQRRVRPVGASTYRDVDVRVIAATNRDLRDEVRAGRFREDLYHRLAVVRVTLPPLRERKEDLPRLVEALLAQPTPATVPAETLALLAEYDWPGNVRELKNVLERARSFADESADGARTIAPGLLGLGSIGGSAEAQMPASFGPVDSESYREAKERLLAIWERQFVTQLLKRTGGNVSRASREGGIDRGYLYRLIKKLGLE